MRPLTLDGVVQEEMVFFAQDADTSHESLKKKVRRGWEMQYNYMLIVGESERAARSVSVRTRGSTVSEPMSLAAFAERLTNEARIPEV